MNLHPQTHKNLYLLFLGIVAISAVYNTIEEHKLRTLRKKEIEAKLNSIS